MTARTEMPRLSDLCTDPRLAAWFAKAERDCPPAPLAVESRPEPRLPPQGAAATRELELA
jgi:hypothetical protein